MRGAIFWVSLTLTPVTLVAHYGFGIEGTPSFVLSAGALAPLAFLIGEATENVAEHTGAGTGGFLNASFGNAPELTTWSSRSASREIASRRSAACA